MGKRSVANRVNHVLRCSGRMPLFLLLVLSVSFAPITWAQTQIQPRSNSENWKNILAAAHKEGRVRLYAITVPEVQDRLKVDFIREYPGIQIETVRMSGGPLVSKVEQERKTGADGADVVILSSENYFVERLSEGTLSAPIGPSLEAWPDQYLIRRAIPILTLEPLVIVYNINQVRGAVNGYEDLLKAEYKGKIGTNDLVSSTMVAWYEWLDKTQGARFTADLAAQRPRIYFGSPAITQAVASGEIAIGAVSTVSSALPLIRQGAPLKVVVPKPAFGYGYPAGILGWGKRPNAAQVLMDYLMSGRGQRALVGNGETASPLPNVQDSLDANSIQPFDAAQYTVEAVKAYRQKWDAMFKK